MRELIVSYDSLKRYVAKHGMYNLTEKPGQVKLIFEPLFEEARSHMIGSFTRFHIYGVKREDKVVFTKIEIENELGFNELDLESAFDSLKVWLEDIEES